MREPNMKWFFQPPDGGVAGQDGRDGTGQDGRDGTGQDGRDVAGQDDDSSAPGLLGLPPTLLERHGARALDPATAAAVHGYPTPRPTVYRARTLLIPGHLLRHDDFVASINKVLEPDGMQLVQPTEGHDPDLDRNSGVREGDREGDRDVFEILRELPRPAVLVPLAGHSTPVKIDAWETLQKLRAVVAQGQELHELTENLQPPILDAETVGQIELEHMLTGSAITGTPAGNSPGGIAGGPGSSSDVSGPTPTDSYLFSGGDPRAPVTVLLPKPEHKRTWDDDRLRDYGRRPVIAVLDSGIRAHPWLDVRSAPGGGYDTNPPDGFVQIDQEIQDAIRDEGLQAVANGDTRRQVIRDASDTPTVANPLVGELNPALGHSTFIAGIVRQVTPDAQVLAVRVMHSDDILNEGDIICALCHLAKRIVLAEAGDPAEMVDVVSLSFGYFSESRQAAVNSGLWKAIKVLLNLGVIVVAAAGNFATRRRFYPAAFAPEPVGAGQVPVISVGALNPNGTKAMFSNDGPWVTTWAQGADVVSTYPIDVGGSRTPDLRMPVNRKPPEDLPPGREALDPNDYSDGFAIWSGTSFSAPYMAALITGSLLEGAEKEGNALKLDLPGKQDGEDLAVAVLRRRNRAEAAVQRLSRLQADRGE
jgi:Subtilase family